MKKWFEIKNASSETAEIWIYEEIGVDWWTGEGLTAKQFQKELSAIKASKIDLHINSMGGEIFEGITVYNLLLQHPATITTYIDGLAASIASVIALAGSKVIMAENAFYMIHNPWGMEVGDANAMRKMADLLDKTASSIILPYANKTGMEEDKIKELMDAETWMTASEALEYGFIDETAGKMDMAACAKFIPAMAKAKFKNIPANIADNKKTPTARQLERVLREHGGCTEQMAKSIIVEGYKGDQRDVAPEADQRDVAAPIKETKVDNVAKKPVRIAERRIGPNYTAQQKEEQNR